MSKSLSPTAVICLSGGRGGMEMDALKLSDLLSGDARTVIVVKSGSFLHQLYGKASYDFDCEPVSFLNRNFSLSMLRSVRRIIKQYGIRNIIYFGASELKTLYFSFLGSELTIVVRHGTTKSRPKRDAFRRLVYSCVDYHVAISKHLLENVRQIVPVHAGTRFEIVYPSFRFANHVKKSTSEQGLLRLIHVGRVVPGKGHRDAIMACAALHDRGIDFELLFLGAEGKGEFGNTLKSLVDELDYAERIRFLGHVDDVNQYFQSADIFLYPSYGEGFGNVFIEAMAHGMTAVTYDNTTFPEFSRMGFVFYMAEDRNIASLSECLLRAADDVLRDGGGSVVNARLAKDLFNRDRELGDWQSILR